jgi:ribosomal protein L14E/L6E/L27E
MQAIHPFEIVLSLAGHDAGRLFVVLDSDSEYLMLADGKERKLAAPKRKKQKHVRGVGTSAHPAIQRLQRGEPVTDKEIRCVLAAFRDSEHPY